MEFACSHVVCNWRPDEAGPVPPPLPPRRLKKPRPTSLPLPSIPPSPTPPPPVPPRVEKLESECSPMANVNVISLSIAKLVNIRQVTGLESFQKPVVCGKCSAALSCLSSVQKNVWVCEFCGCEHTVDNSVRRVCVGQRTGTHSDDLYLPNHSDDDYQNVEDTMVVFCVDISGSMGVTTEVASSSGSKAYVSRLEGIQNALQKALSSLLQQSPRRRVALVTFNNEVVVYGDGTSTPLTLRDWALVDYDYIWQQGVSYSIPHCIAETYNRLKQTVKDLTEHGATSLGPAVLASVAVASRYPGSKVILCTDGIANIGLGKMEDTPSVASSFTPYFYKQLAQQAVENGVIISVMTFEGTDCCLADIGRLADSTGGRVNMVSISTVATEIQLASMDNVLATGVTATLLAPEGVFFPYEDESNHKIVKEIGNVTSGLEITSQFAVKPRFLDVFLQKALIPFQLQLSFKTRDQQKVVRVITELRPVTSCSPIWRCSLNMAVLGVHCAQLCATLTMEGRVQEAQKQLKAQQDLLKQISEQRPIQKEESIYSNWMDTMTTICHDISTKPRSPDQNPIEHHLDMVEREGCIMDVQVLTDEAAKVMYQMKRATSVRGKYGNPTEIQKKNLRKKNETLGEGKQ